MPEIEAAVVITNKGKLLDYRNENDSIESHWDA